MTRTVLIVEDADLCREALELAFMGIPRLLVKTVGTAEEALLQLNHGNISALVTDLNLPSMDGFELIERVRAQPGRSALPILVISGDSDPHTPERVAGLGANLIFPSRTLRRKYAADWSGYWMRIDTMRIDTMRIDNRRSKHFLVSVVLSLPAVVCAQAVQSKTDLQLILERLDRLEQQNRDLSAQVTALRAELAAARATAPASPSAVAQTQPAEGTPSSEVQAPVPLDERVAIQEQRTSDLAQSKVEAAHRFPVSLTGLLLFNAFLNGRSSGGLEYPAIASVAPGSSGSGATVSQTILGLTFQGPHVFGGGSVNGQLHMDFWGGSPSNSVNHLMRLRVATVSIDWKNRSLTVGQDKPIVSPRDPTSLAQVAFSPLVDAGNIWLWQPQVRFEQRIALGDDSGIRARVGVYQTSQSNVSSEYVNGTATPRPAIEGRFELWHKFGKSARIEVAPGFHTSQTHVAGFTVASRLFTADWLIQPSAKVQLTGLFFHGQDPAGIGAMPVSFNFFSPTQVRPVQTAGGWAQLSYFATPRLSFNVYSGQQSNRPLDLISGQITRNFEYAGNAIYKLGSNVVLGIEAAQLRTSYLQNSLHLVNHYDAALGYLF